MRKISSIFLLTVVVVISIVVFFRLGKKEDALAEKKEKTETHVTETTEPNEQEEENSVQVETMDPSVVYELPACAEAQIIRHMGYSLQYDEGYEQARWVAYQLTEAETVKSYKRTDAFLPDPEVKSGSANDSDYKRSGFDRGHLAPAADMGWSAQTMAESFYYSNMSPQLPGFNRGIWKRLEEQVRSWAVELDTIYVVTGPVFSPKMNYIGPDHVAVPNYYYKAILYMHGTDRRAIGFIMENRASKAELYSYAVSIDSVEKVTGLDFFPALEDKWESEIEKSSCVSCWNWSKGRAANERSNSNRETASVQCSGITRAGNRCKRMTRNPNGRCYQHQ